MGEIANTFSGGTPSVSNKSYYNGDIPFIRSAEINKEKTELFLTQEGIANSSAKLVRKGTLLYALYGATSGEVGIAKINGAINQAIMAIEPKKDNSYFIESWLIKNKEHIITTYLQGGQGNLSAKIIKSLSLGLPKIKEQFKVRDLITIVDYLISLQQQKLEQLKQLKKAMLRQLLASKELSPSIRFKNFTEAWEQRKLGKVASFYSGGTPSVSNSNYYGGTIPFIRSSEINSISTELYLSKQGLQNSSAKMVRQGDILYALYGATSGEVGISNIHGAINQAILAIIPNKNYDSKFLVQWLRKNKEAIIKTYLQGGQGNLSGAIVKQIKISFPNFDEQEKIGEFFKQLDFLITLHQRETNILSNLKKFFLQNLFI